MTMGSQRNYSYIDLRFGNKGRGRYAYLLGLFGQGAIVALFVLWLLPMAAEHPFSKGAIVMGLAFILFAWIFLLHLRATLRAKYLVQEAVVDGEDVWVRCMFGHERRLRRDDVKDYRWIRGRDWFNFMDTSYMDNPERSNIALDLSDGSVLYLFNDGEKTPKLLEALSENEGEKEVAS